MYRPCQARTRFRNSWHCVRDSPTYHAGIKDYMQSAMLFELIAKLITVTVTIIGAWGGVGGLRAGSDLMRGEGAHFPKKGCLCCPKRVLRNGLPKRVRFRSGIVPDTSRTRMLPASHPPLPETRFGEERFRKPVSGMNVSGNPFRG